MGTPIQSGTWAMKRPTDVISEIESKQPSSQAAPDAGKGAIFFMAAGYSPCAAALHAMEHAVLTSCPDSMLVVENYSKILSLCPMRGGISSSSLDSKLAWLDGMP